MLQDDTGDVDGTISRNWSDGVMRAAEIENTTGAGACVRLGEIRRVAVDGEDHRAGRESDGGIGVGAGVIQELGEVLERGGGGCGLGGG